MNNYYQYNDELYHHGVKGMKWGVLRSRTAVLYDKNPGHKAESPNSSSKNPYEGEVYTAKKAYKQAKKDYKNANKEGHKKLGDSLKYETRHIIGVYGSKNKRAKAIELENEALKSGEHANKKYKAMKSAKEAYKQAKKESKQAKKENKREYWLEQGRIAAAERDAARARKLSKKNGSDATRAKIKRAKSRNSIGKVATAPLRVMGSGVATVGSAGVTGVKRVKRDVKRTITKKR